MATLKKISLYQLFPIISVIFLFLAKMYEANYPYRNPSRLVEYVHFNIQYLDALFFLLAYLIPLFVSLKVWTTTSIKSWAPTYFYTTDGRSGAIYRGYLTRVSDISLIGYNTYEGYLYKSDLKYPMPARLMPETTSKWEGVSIYEKNIKE